MATESEYFPSLLGYNQTFFLDKISEFSSGDISRLFPGKKYVNLIDLKKITGSLPGDGSILYNAKILNYSRNQEKDLRSLPNFIMEVAHDIEYGSNEYLILDYPSTDPDLLKICHDLLFLIGAARSIIYENDLAGRIYNFLFYPRICTGADQEKFLVMPWINMVREKGSYNFRNTISFFFILIPVSESIMERRDLTKPEMENVFAEIFEDLTVMQGKNFCKIRGYSQEFIDAFFKSIGIELSKQDYENSKDNCMEVMFLIDRRISYEDITSYFGEGENGILEKYLYDHIGFQEYHKEESLPRTIKFRELSILPPYGFDMDHMSFYDPTNGRIVEILPREREYANSWTVLWGYIWDMYESAGILCTRASISHAFESIEEKIKQEELISKKLELMETIDEFYELVYKFRLYKMEYSKLKEITGIESDYRILKEKLDSIKEDIITLNEQKMSLINTVISYLLLVFSLSNILIAVTLLPLAKGIKIIFIAISLAVTFSLAIYLTLRIRNINRLLE